MNEYENNKTMENNIKLEVNTRPAQSTKNPHVLGYATVKIGDLMYIKNIQIVQSESGPFVSMPSVKNREGNFQPVCFPSKEFRPILDKAVLNTFSPREEAYQKFQPDKGRANFEIKVTPYDKDGIKGFIQLKIPDVMYFNNVSVRENENGNLLMDNYGKELPEYFNTSKDIAWKDRVDMQAALQEHVDTAISSTINLPNSATQEEIEHLYMYAWEKGLKGVTIFRDGCKRVGILSTDNTKKEEKEETKTTTVSIDKDNTTFSFDNLPRGVVINVDNDVIGKKRKLITGCGSLHCIALFDPTTGDLLETYLSKGSTGGCNNFMVGLSRMISTSARGGVDIYTIVDQLKSTGACPSYAVRSATKHDTSKGSCCPMAVGNALLDMYEELHRELFVDDDDDSEEKFQIKKTVSPAPQKEVTVATPKKNPCPSCGEELTFEGGCNICKNCGWSKCD